MRILSVNQQIHIYYTLTARPAVLLLMITYNNGQAVAFSTQGIQKRDPSQVSSHFMAESQGFEPWVRSSPHT